MFNVIVAADMDRGIGKDNKLPWRLKKDMQFFKDMTTYIGTGNVMRNYGLDEDGPIDLVKPSENAMNAVIMGRKTWDSIPEKFRPLPDRLNVVISRGRSITMAHPHMLRGSLQSALDSLTGDHIKNIFVIGGGEIYKEALEHAGCSNIFLTEVYKRFECDVHLPDYSSNFKLMSISPEHEEKDIRFRFGWLQRKM